MLLRTQTRHRLKDNKTRDLRLDLSDQLAGGQLAICSLASVKLTKGQLASGQLACCQLDKDQSDSGQLTGG